MTQINVNAEDIVEVGAYEEAGALVFGVRFKVEILTHNLIFQIDTEESDQRQDKFGMYFEFDGKGVYGAVRRFEFNRSYCEIVVELNPSKTDGTKFISINISSVSAREQELVGKMMDEFKEYPK